MIATLRRLGPALLLVCCGLAGGGEPASAADVPVEAPGSRVPDAVAEDGTGPLEETPVAAAQTTLPAAMYAVGQQALARRDFASALAWLGLAAEHDHTGAQAELGRLYLADDGVAANPGEAMQWTQRAALGGDIAAQNRLGEMFRDAVGVDNDDAEAVWWFTKAAEQNDAAAQGNLGRMIVAGRGGSADRIDGAQWLQLAALQDNPSAQFALGRLLIEGDGIAPDPAAGRVWLERAALRGHTAARDYLRQHPPEAK